MAGTFVVVLIAVLMTVAMVFQVLPLVTVPVTQSLTLSTFNNTTFGVFGWCCVSNNSLGKNVTCTDKGLGYKTTIVDVLGHALTLPSNTKISVTKLLVIHVFALMCSLIMWITVLLLLFTQLGQSPQFALLAALLSLPTFLLSLLSFLIDILLFFSNLDWTGWFILVSTIMIAICCSLLWTVRRTVTVKHYKLLQEQKETIALVESVPILEDKPSDVENNGNSSLDQPLLEPELSYRGTLT